MSKPIVFMFSGQGSQYWDMGKVLYEDNAVFRKWMLDLNDLVQIRTGNSVLAHIYHSKRGRTEVFDQLEYSHPAIFMVEYALAQTLKSIGITPNIVIGSSLGEITAATVAGVIDVETALEWITEQAKIVQTSCHQGSMMAVLHHIDLYTEVEVLNRNSTLVSVNYDGHFVISGTATQMKEIQYFLNAKGIMSQFLPVPYAFHSPMIDPMEEAYKRVLKPQALRSPEVMMVSSINGESVRHIQSDYFWQIVREQIQFSKGIQQIENLDRPIYIDLSPSSTLANFVKRSINRKDLACFSLLTPFHQELKNLDYLQRFHENLGEGMEDQ